MARVLVVDDERSMRDFLRICLTRDGHQVSLAEGPAAAREALSVGSPIDVVVTDLKMQGGSGLDVLSAVKEKSPETQVVVRFWIVGVLMLLLGMSSIKLQ